MKNSMLISMLALVMGLGLTGCPPMQVYLSAYDSDNNLIPEQTGPIGYMEAAYSPGYAVEEFTGAEFDDSEDSIVSYVVVGDDGLETKTALLSPESDKKNKKTWEDDDLGLFLIPAVIAGLGAIDWPGIFECEPDGFTVVIPMGPRVVSATATVQTSQGPFTIVLTGDGQGTTPDDCGGGEVRVEKDGTGDWLLKVGIGDNPLGCLFASTDSGTAANFEDAGSAMGAYIYVNEQSKILLDQQTISRGGMNTWNLSSGVFADEAIPASFRVGVWVQNLANPDEEDPAGLWWAITESFGTTGPVELKDGLWEVKIPGATLTYTLSTSVSPSGAGTVTGGGDYASGATATLTATANSGYSFTGWSGDASGSANTTSIVMNGNKAVTAHFTQSGGSTYTLSTSASPSGAGYVTGGGTYNSGATVTVTATANSGWVFSHWSGDASGSTSTTSIVMNGNKAVTAHFVVSTTPTGIAMAVSGTTATFYPENIQWVDESGNAVSGTPTKIGFRRYYDGADGYRSSPWESEMLVTNGGSGTTATDANVFETSRLTYDGHVIIKGNVIGQMASGKSVFANLPTSGPCTYGGSAFPIVGNALKLQVK